MDQITLVRLDGYQSKRFIASSKAKTGLASNNVSSLIFDHSSKKLWIGTANGLSVYHTVTESFVSYKHQVGIKGSLSNNVIKVIFKDAKGRIWIGTQGGLNLFDASKNTFSVFVNNQSDQHSISHNHIMDIAEDRAGNLWIATQSGLNRFKENGVFERHAPFKNEDGSDGMLSKIAIDNSERLWLGTEQNGLLRYEPKTRLAQFIKAGNNGASLLSNYIRALMFDKDGALWIGTNAGMSIYSPTDQNFLNITNNSELNGNVVSFFEDSNNVVWVGTWAKGLHYFNPRETQIGKLDLKMLKSDGDTLKSIIIDNNNYIWFSNPKYLFKMDSANGVIKKYDLKPINPTANRAAPFYDKSTGKLFLLTDHIYDVTDLSDIKMFELPAKLRNISWYGATIDNNGRAWLGSRSVGVFVLDDDFKTIVKHLDTAMAGFIRPISTNTMLVGTYTATYWVDINSFNSEKHTPEDIPGMLHPNVTGYQRTSMGEQWMATSGGIHQLLEDEQGKKFYKTWTQEDGLPTDVLTGPIEDSEGKLWFSSTDGLIRFNPKTFNIEHYDIPLGAFANYYIGQYLKDDNQRMFFVGPKGVSIIDERHVRSNKTPYPVILNELRVKGVEQSLASDNVLKSAIEYTNNITLNPQSRDFTFSFSTTYMTRTDSVKYYYRLVGFQDEWLETGADRRQLKYTNLNPGKYRFEIYSRSINGVNSDTKGIDVVIEPMYYETLSFRIFVAVLVLAMFFGWYRYRMYKIKQYNLELQSEVEQRTQDIKTLADIGKDISATLDTNELLQQLYHHLNKSLDASVLAVGVYEAEHQRILFDSSMEDGELMPFHERQMNPEKDIAAWCVHHKKEVILNEHSEIFNYISHDIGPVVGDVMQSVVYLPIRSRSNRMLGCMTVQSRRKNAYKPEDIEFIRTIGNYTGIAMDNALAHNELKKVSSTDFLTNLPNRRSFIEQFEQQIKIVRRSKQPMSLAMGDIDHFKQFNDIHGHECGDYVLQQVAKIYRSTVREQDIVARWGGEEFIFLFFNTPLEGAKVALDKIRTKLEHTDLEFEGKKLNVTSTFGAALYFDCENYEDIINLADEALYQGKEAGRNQVMLYQSTKPIEQT